MLSGSVGATGDCESDNRSAEEKMKKGTELVFLVNLVFPGLQMNSSRSKITANS